MGLTKSQERKRRRRLRDRFPFSENCLVIRTKDVEGIEGGISPSTLNCEQLYIHRVIEKQLRETGWGCVIILKGRQQGRRGNRNRTSSLFEACALLKPSETFRHSKSGSDLRTFPLKTYRMQSTGRQCTTV